MCKFVTDNFDIILIKRICLAEIDKQKEWVNFWKTLFFVLLGAIFGIIGYTFNKFSELSELQLIFLLFASISLSITNILVLKKLKKEIEKLKDL